MDAIIFCMKQMYVDCHADNVDAGVRISGDGTPGAVNVTGGPGSYLPPTAGNYVWALYLQNGLIPTYGPPGVFPNPNFVPFEAGAPTISEYAAANELRQIGAVQFAVTCKCQLQSSFHASV